MLDDNNVLDQFFVREYLRGLGEDIEKFQFPKPDLTYDDPKKVAEVKDTGVSDKKDSKKPKVEIKKLIIVTEDGAKSYASIKTWLDTSRTSLSCPVVLSDDLNSAWLDEQTLVLFEQVTWFWQERVDKLRALAHKKAQVAYVRHGFSALLGALLEFGVISKLSSKKFREILQKSYAQAWKEMGPSRSLAKNLAKQTALFIAGKTAVSTSNVAGMPMAESFALQIRQLACNLAFSEELMWQMTQGKWGWSSHPVEKPFATFVLKYDFSPAEEHLLKERARQLSGLMPASKILEIKAENYLEALVQADLMAHFVASYLAVLNKKVLPHA